MFFLSPALYAASEELPKALDDRHRHNHKNQFEISLNGGDYLGDQTGNSWTTGAKAYFSFNSIVGVGVNYAYTPLSVDSSSNFGQFLKTKDTHMLDAEVMLNNAAAFRAGKVIECDLYLTLGVGTIWIDRKYKPMGMVGGGMKIYGKPDWLAFRIDVNSYLHPTPNPGGDKFNGDMAMTLGISFLFPVRQRVIEFEEKVSIEEEVKETSKN